MTSIHARLLIHIGLGLQAVRLVFEAFTAYRMSRVFATITEFGTGDPEALSRGISESLTYAAAGFFAGLIGLALMLGGIFGGGLRERWAWWCSVIAGLTWLPFFPIGTIIGGTAIVAVVPRIVARDFVYLPKYEDVMPFRRFFHRSEHDVRRTHIHMVGVGTPFWHDHLLFRDHLRRDTAARGRYEALKRELAEREWSGMTTTPARRPGLSKRCS